MVNSALARLILLLTLTIMELEPIILGLFVGLQSLCFITLFSSQTYIFEAPVEDLQFLLGELSLLLQLVHALRAMTHSG